MATIQFPETLGMAKQTWGQKRNDVMSASAFGGAQSLEASHPLWNMVLTPPAYMDSEVGAFQSLLLSLKGRANLLACHNLRRPQPLGTMRGTMTLDVAAEAGATTMQMVATGEGDKTLLAGDYLGLGNGFTQQVVMLTADAISDASGIISVSFEAPLRNAFAIGAVVTWDKPKALFRRTDANTSWDYEKAKVSVSPISFIEDWRS